MPMNHFPAPQNVSEKKETRGRGCTEARGLPAVHWAPARQAPRSLPCVLGCLCSPPRSARPALIHRKVCKIYRISLLKYLIFIIGVDLKLSTGFEKKKRTACRNLMLNMGHWLYFHFCYHSAALVAHKKWLFFFKYLNFHELKLNIVGIFFLSLLRLCLRWKRKYVNVAHLQVCECPFAP